MGLLKIAGVVGAFAALAAAALFTPGSPLVSHGAQLRVAIGLAHPRPVVGQFFEATGGGGCYHLSSLRTVATLGQSYGSRPAALAFIDSVGAGECEVFRPGELLEVRSIERGPVKTMVVRPFGTKRDLHTVWRFVRSDGLDD